MSDRRAEPTMGLAISVAGLGKMYKLFRRPADKILDALGVARWLFWRRAAHQEFWALREFDLQVHRGERIGIIGRNGAGKSTLLKIIAGNVSPTEGEVRIRGRVQALMELGTGFHPEFTGRENIRASLALQGLPPARIRRLEDEIVDFAELDDFIDQPIKTYSAGMTARLGFSTATTIEPEILIIDEVLGAGDAYFAGKCIERMRRLTEESGATVLFVSHDLGSVQQLCDRVVWIHRGRILGDGEPLEVIKAYTEMVRQEESIRLRARDLKVLRSQAARLDSPNDVVEKRLFHIVPSTEGKPRPGQLRVYELRLLAGGAEVGRIEVGRPMDNDADSSHYLIDTPEFMDWGPPVKDEHGWHREYVDLGGKYEHAPFEFAIPRALLDGTEAGGLRIEVTCRGEIEVALEMFSGERYVPVGRLPAGPHRVVALDLEPRGRLEPGDGRKPSPSDAEPSSPIAAPLDPTPSTAAETSSPWGTGEVTLRDVCFLDREGERRSVFLPGEPIRIRLLWVARAPVERAVFSATAYKASGEVAACFVAPTEELGTRPLSGDGRVDLDLDPCHLGPDRYVLSVAVRRPLDDPGFADRPHHEINRAFHFEVLADPSRPFARGAVLQPFRAALHPEEPCPEAPSGPVGPDAPVARPEERRS